MQHPHVYSRSARTLLYSLLGSAALLSMPKNVIAQSPPGVTPGGSSSSGNGSSKPSDYFDNGGTIESNSGLPTGSVIDYVLNILGVVLGFTGLIALVLILYAGFMILTSAGNEERIAKGKEILIWAVVGLVIIFSSLGIVIFLNNNLF